MAHQEMMAKVATQDGFLAALDQSGGSTPKALKQYGVEESEYSGEAEMMDRVHDMRRRIIMNPKFDGSRVIGAILFEATMDRNVDAVPTARYLWEKKKVVPFLKVDKGLAEERDGVQLMKDVPDLEKLLDKAVSNGVFGTKERSVIKQANPAGIRAAAQQQFEFGLRVLAKGLVPILEPEVDIHCPNKEQAERLLLDALMDGLRKLEPEQKVMFKLTLPTRPNYYLPLLGHPNTLRVVALSGGYNRAQACDLLGQNVGVIASFSRAFAEGLHARQTEEEFTKVVDQSCEAIYQASRAGPDYVLKMARVAIQDGFFAALDQSGGSTPKALKLYGVEESEYSGEAQMMDKVHEMRSRIITNHMFNGSRIVGAILFEATMDRTIEGVPTAKYLWEQKRVVPFLKIDQGLAQEKDGVQLMKEIPDLDKLLDKAVSAGVFGTKERSVIKQADPAGIRTAVDQQFEVARRVIAKGLLPILEPEVDIKCPEKELAECFLLDALLAGLRGLSPNEKVMFKLTLPTRPNFYMPVMGHPNTVRVVALSGGYDRAKSCELLMENHGVIASFSRAFLEGMNVKQTEEEFTKVMDDSCQAIYQASRVVSLKEEQLVKISKQDGFFTAMDQPTPEPLKLYGVEEAEYKSEAEMMDKIHAMRSRIISNPKFEGSRVLGAILVEGAIDRTVEGIPTARYLWEERRVVPVLKVDKGLQDERDGVQLMKDMPDLDAKLDKALAHGIFVTAQRSVINLAVAEGIKAIVEQQFEVGRRVIRKGLVPILELEVDASCPDKEKAERLLLDELMAGLRKFAPDEKVIFKVTLPTKPNAYMPLMGHPNTLRVLSSSAGYDRAQACKLLSENVGMVAGGRALAHGLHVKQTDEEFTSVLDASCEAILQASKSASYKEEQWVKIAMQDGFLAALDQSGGSTPKALKLYGVEESEYSGEAEMMAKVHEMRSRIIRNPMFNGARVLGAILFEATMDGTIDGVPTAKYLWEKKRIVPFLKIDKGLAEEKDGVQLMKEMPQLEALLDKAVAAGIFGTKERSVIKQADPAGIRAAAEQQFEVARRVLAKGLMPIVEPEVDIKCPDKEQAEDLLLEALSEGLAKLPEDQKVMFKLTIPTRPNAYLQLVRHPKVLRVVALSGGYDRAESCKLLAQNAGVIASFSRAFAEGMSAKQSEEEFSRTVDESCEAIYRASRAAPSPEAGGA